MEESNIHGCDEVYSVDLFPPAAFCGAVVVLVVEVMVEDDGSDGGGGGGGRGEPAGEAEIRRNNRASSSRVS